MAKRIGWSAGVVGVVIGAILGVFEVQEWKMPDEIAISLLVLLSLAGLVAVGVLIHAMLGPRLGFMRRIQSLVEPETDGQVAWLKFINHGDPGTFEVSCELDSRDTGEQERPYYAPWRETTTRGQVIAAGPPASFVNIAEVNPTDSGGSTDILMNQLIRSKAKGRTLVRFYSTTLKEGWFYRSLAPEQRVRLTATVRRVDAEQFSDSRTYQLWVDHDERLHFEEA